MDRDDLVERLERYGKGEHVGSWRADTFREAAAEIRSLREQVAQERAGIVRWLRMQAEVRYEKAQAHSLMGRDYHSGYGNGYAQAADAIEAQQDKEPQV